MVVLSYPRSPRRLGSARGSRKLEVQAKRCKASREGGDTDRKGVRKGVGGYSEA